MSELLVSVIIMSELLVSVIIMAFVKENHVYSDHVYSGW